MRARWGLRWTVHGAGVVTSTPRSVSARSEKMRRQSSESIAGYSPVGRRRGCLSHIYAGAGSPCTRRGHRCMRLQTQRPWAGWLTTRRRGGGARAGATPAWACLRCMVDDACQCVSTLAHWNRYVCRLCSVLVHAYGARVFGKWGTGSCPRVRQEGREKGRMPTQSRHTQTGTHTHD
jgi:hypothetical protein